MFTEGWIPNTNEAQLSPKERAVVVNVTDKLLETEGFPEQTSRINRLFLIETLTKHTKSIALEEDIGEITEEDLEFSWDFYKDILSLQHALREINGKSLDQIDHYKEHLEERLDIIRYGRPQKGFSLKPFVKKKETFNNREETIRDAIGNLYDLNSAIKTAEKLLPQA